MRLFFLILACSIALARGTHAEPPFPGSVPFEIQVVPAPLTVAVLTIVLFANPISASPLFTVAPPVIERVP